jgi:hypothetical protein
MKSVTDDGEIIAMLSGHVCQVLPGEGLSLCIRRPNLGWRDQRIGDRTKNEYQRSVRPS